MKSTLSGTATQTAPETDEQKIRRWLLITRGAQLVLIVILCFSLAQHSRTLGQSLDFAMNRPVTTEEQRRTVLEELPRFFMASDPDAVVLEAIEAGDISLAALYVEYAATWRSQPLKPETLEAYDDATGWWATAKRAVSDCGMGAVWREADNVTAVSCQLATDLFVVGDLADIGKEGWAWYNDEEYDEVVLGLSMFGAGASVLSVAMPAAVGAAGGVAAAKVVVRPAAKGFRISAPMRTAVKNAVDFGALNAAVKNVGSWRQAKALLTNPKQFLRPKEAELLMNGLSDVARIGTTTGAATATRVMRRAGSFDDLATAGKVIDLTGTHSKMVLNVMGLKAMKVAKAARPLVSYSKYTYKAGAAFSAIGVALAAAAFELLFRRGAWKLVRKKRTALKSSLKAGKAPAPVFWKDPGQIGFVVLAGLMAAMIAGGSYLYFENQWLVQRGQLRAQNEEQRLVQMNAVYLETIREMAVEDKQVQTWLDQPEIRLACGMDIVGGDARDCRREIEEFHRTRPLRAL